VQGFYNILDTVKTQLEDDPIVTTVTTGDIFDIDLNKKTLFPLSHISVNQATLEGAAWRFNITVYAIDILDFSKENSDSFKGNDNEHDIWNTQLAVLSRMLEALRRGDLFKDLYQLDGNPVCEPFTERFENNLAGWACTFDVIIKNDMSIC
jgi:hypothetical protein